MRDRPCPASQAAEPARRGVTRRAHEARIEARTGIGARLALTVVASSLVTPLMLAVPAIVRAGLDQGADAAFEMTCASVRGMAPVAILLWPVTLPGTLLLWAGAWYLGWRRGWPELGRAVLAGVAAGAGATLGLLFWLGMGGDASAGAAHGMSIIALAAMLAGAVAAFVIYHPVWQSGRVRSLQ